jgi:osmoprotectant transport system permease protein
MMDQLADRIAELPRLLAGHMLLSVTALAVGIGISIPLGLAATRHPRLRGPLLRPSPASRSSPSWWSCSVGGSDSCPHSSP